MKVNIYHYKFLQTLRPYNTKSGNYGLWVIMVCQYRFIDCNRYTILVGDINSGGQSVCVQAEGIGELCTFHSIFPGTQNYSKK